MINDVEAGDRDVIRPYLTANDIAEDPTQSPSRWIIDFGQMPLEQARRYSKAFQIVRERVKPFRETVNREGHRIRWWQYGEPRVGLRKQLEGKARYIAIGAHAKRAMLAWYETRTLASNACMAFTFDDDFSMGVLQARAHVAWAWHQASTIKGDLRYTPTSVFATFPWPDQATYAHRGAAGFACVELLARRSEICDAENIGLTALYNSMDEGAYADLKALHRALDEAVAACYGWPKSVAQDDAEIVVRLTELNRQISVGERTYEPFAYLDRPGDIASS